MECVHYLRRVLPVSRLRERIGAAAQCIQGLPEYKARKVTVLACTGLSGLLVAPSVALQLRLELVVVRKEGETRHSARRVEYGTSRKKSGGWLFIDDFQDSEKTERRVCALLREERPGWLFLGKVLYAYYDASGRLTAQWFPPESQNGEVVSCVRIE